MSTVSKLTYQDYVKFPDDGQRHEIINGEHFVNPAPGTYHQDLSRHIQFQLYAAIELTGLGRVYDAPCDVQLTESDIVQPDIIVVLQAKIRKITPTKIKCVPDLLIEILSPSTRTYDNTDKKQLYEREKVPEYWIVDPQEHSVTRWLLDESDRYSASTIETESITYRGIPDGVVVDLTRVW